MSIYADDLHIGQKFAFSRYFVSEDDIVEYARQWDPVYIHADPVAAHSGPLVGVIASGLHTLAIYQRLAVEALWSRFAGGVGRSFDVHFRRPVRPGTTLTGSATVESVTPRPERGDAIVLVSAELIDDAGEIVLDLRLDGALPTRPSVVN